MRLCREGGGGESAPSEEALCNITGHNMRGGAHIFRALGDAPCHRNTVLGIHPPANFFRRDIFMIRQSIPEQWRTPIQTLS